MEANRTFLSVCQFLWCADALRMRAEIDRLLLIMYCKKIVEDIERRFKNEKIALNGILELLVICLVLATLLQQVSYILSSFCCVSLLKAVKDGLGILCGHKPCI